MGDGEHVIREVWRRWNAGDREPDLETFDPEMEVKSALTGQTYRRAEGFRRWIVEIDQQFEAWELDLDEIHERAPGHYLAHGAIHARGRTSGVGLDQPASWRIDVRDGRILRLANYIGSDARIQAERAGS